jgi:hypothetical protein
MSSILDMSWCSPFDGWEGCPSRRLSAEPCVDVLPVVVSKFSVLVANTRDHPCVTVSDCLLADDGETITGFNAENVFLGVGNDETVFHAFVEIQGGFLGGDAESARKNRD